MPVADNNDPFANQLRNGVFSFSRASDMSGRASTEEPDGKPSGSSAFQDEMTLAILKSLRTRSTVVLPNNPEFELYVNWSWAEWKLDWPYNRFREIAIEHLGLEAGFDVDVIAMVAGAIHNAD